ELVAGTYEGATRYPFQSPTVPGLSISGDGRGCNTLTGRFVVLDVTYGPTGDVLGFAADFEQHCEGGSDALFGSIRFRSGDAGCLGAPDGAACDDGDACTAASSCRAGACEAGDAIPCAPAGQCEAAACSPTSGACVTRAVRDYTSCDDGDLCTAGESCMGGVCTGGVQALPCYDGDPRTADLCHPRERDLRQPTGCPHRRRPWTEH